MYILTIEVTEQSLVGIIIISILHIRNLSDMTKVIMLNLSDMAKVMMLNQVSTQKIWLPFLTTLKASLHSITDYNALKHPTPHLISIATLQRVTMGNCKPPHHSFGILFAHADSD